MNLCYVMYSNIMWKSVNLILASCCLICPSEHRGRRTSNQGKHRGRRTSNQGTLDPIVH